MTQTEKTFLARTERLAKHLERMAENIRVMAHSDYPAMERTEEIIAIAESGIGKLGMDTLVKRAALADRERENEASN